MKFTINLSGKTLYTTMRSFGYAPSFDRGRNLVSPTASQEFVFQRLLAGREYPKFHAYCTVSHDTKSATINLHLDQKQPSYAGSHAHNAEHSGLVVETEVERIRSQGVH